MFIFNEDDVGNQSEMFDYSMVDQIVEIIVRDFHPERIIIFGSVARHEATDDSDLDILVVMDTDRPHFRRSSPIKHRVYETFLLPMDMIVLTPQEFEAYKDVDTSLAHHIVSTGVVTYAS